MKLPEPMSDTNKLIHATILAYSNGSLTIEECIEIIKLFLSKESRPGGDIEWKIVVK